MSSRFAPTWATVERIIDSLANNVSSEHLTNAFSTVSSATTAGDYSVEDLKRQLRLWIVGTEQIPWVFYDTVSEIIKRVPEGQRDLVVRSSRIGTARGLQDHEWLQVTPNGLWQVAWEVDPVEDTEIVLDWYLPPQLDSAPIVPVHIIDYIASCVISLRQDLVLPAAAALLVALESSLWYALGEAEEGVGFIRSITYDSVAWHARLRGTEANPWLMVEVEDADTQLSFLKSVLDENRDFGLTARRMQSREGSPSISFTCEVDATIADFLTTSRIQNEQEDTDRGLRNALEKGRSINLRCLQSLDSRLDETLITLRNNLAHLPFKDECDRLHPPIPILQRELRTVGELKASKLQIQGLLYWVIEVINSAYVTKLEEIQVEGL